MPSPSSSSFHSSIFDATPGGIERQKELYQQQEDAINAGKHPLSDPRLMPYLDRRVTHLQKIAMLLSASEGDSMVIDEATFSRADRLLLEMEHMMPRVFWGWGRSESAPLTADIEGAIRGHRTITFGDLMRAFRSETDVDGLRKIVRKLKIAGLVEQEKNLITYVGEL